MSEREMREALRKVCEKLELEARAEAKKSGRKLVYPLMVGAGLLMINCDDESRALYMAPSGSPTASQTGTAGGTTTGTATGGGGEGGTSTGATGGGGAGGSTGGGAVGGGSTGGGAVGGAQMDYMAPDA